MFGGFLSIRPCMMRRLHLFQLRDRRLRARIPASRRVWMRAPPPSKRPLPLTARRKRPKSPLPGDAPGSVAAAHPPPRLSHLGGARAEAKGRLDEGRTQEEGSMLWGVAGRSFGVVGDCKATTDEWVQKEGSRSDAAVDCMRKVQGPMFQLQAEGSRSKLRGVAQLRPMSGCRRKVRGRMLRRIA